MLQTVKVRTASAIPGYVHYGTYVPLFLGIIERSSFYLSLQD